MPNPDRLGLQITVPLPLYQEQGHGEALYGWLSQVLGIDLARADVVYTHEMPALEIVRIDVGWPVGEDESRA